MRFIILTLIVSFSITGCIVKGPKYTHVENVLNLNNGMTLKTVNETLKLRPYDLRSLDSAGNKVLIYKYRLTDRRTVPLFLKDTNGKNISSKFMDLHCTFDSKNILVKLESKSTNSELKEQRLNINSLITFLTVTAPAFLVYLGITANP